jgi:hypothetical protein
MPQTGWPPPPSDQPSDDLILRRLMIGDPAPPQFFFRDIDGNRFLIVRAG